jgi:F-type H+-transporting ATPase subunit b
MGAMETILSAAAEGGHADENVIVPPVGELIIGTVAFGLLVLFFFRSVYPKMKVTYATRTERIEGSLVRAERAQQEAQALLEQYRSQLTEARTEAGRIREEAHAQGRAIIDELRERAHQEVEEIKVRATAQLEADRAQVVAQLRREVGSVALELATKIVGHELATSAAQQRLVDDFIASLDAAPPAPAPAGSGG